MNHERYPMNPLYLALMQQQGQQSSPMAGSAPEPMPSQPLPFPQSISPSYTNPFDSGITKAIEGARASIAASEAQKAQALTTSLTALAKAAAQASNQTPWGMSKGAGLGHILAQAAPYGVEAYGNAERQAEQENLGLADYMVKLKSTQDEALRKLLKEQLDRQHQDDVLTETKRHHGAQEKKQELMLQLKNLKMSHLIRAEEKQHKEEEERRLEDEAIARGETPLSVLEKPARAEYQKNALKTIRDVSVNKRAVETIAKMRTLFELHPDIGSDFTQWLAGSSDPKKETGFWTVMGRKFADKKKLAALQQLKKHSADLNLSTVLGTPGKVGTDLLKKMIAESSTSGHLTKEGFDSIAGGIESRARKNIRMAEKYREGLKRKIVVMDDEEESAPAQTNPGAPSDLSDVSTEDLMRELQALEGQ
jgi:hypothetical protein